METLAASSPTTTTSDRSHGDVKRLVWLALLVMVLYTTVSFDSTTIDLYKSTMYSNSFFQGEASIGALFAASTAMSHAAMDWQTELIALTAADDSNCPPEFVFHGETYERQSNATRNRYQIPSIVHIRVSSQCLSSASQQQVQAWKKIFGKHYQIVVHDDNAEKQLLFERYWKQFPHIKHTMIPCASSESRRDLWKALVLYQYGGIVLDLGQLQAPSEVSTLLEESFLTVLENSTAPALLILDDNQRLTNALLAAPPRHPFSYLWAHTLLVETMTLRSVDEQWNGRGTTGESLRTALVHFQKQMHRVGNVTEYVVKPALFTQHEAHDATVRVMDSAELPWFKTQNVSVESPLPQSQLMWGNTDTCLMRIYRVHESLHKPPQIRTADGDERQFAKTHG